MILITGGAGYIGAHTLYRLRDKRIPAVVLDNLTTGERDFVPPDVPFYEGDIADVSLVEKIIKEHNVDAVIHFAAKLSVPESVKLPHDYYENNLFGTSRLIDTAVRCSVKHFVFSSTCAVYGSVKNNPVDETFPYNPESPYGRSKLATEWYLKDMCGVSDMRCVVLRYFNVVGARQSGEIGCIGHDWQLFENLGKAALGKKDAFCIFGTDYNTKDGTCVRDYVHVDDLADAHILALDYLQNGGKSDVFNCGYGIGYSVKEIVEAYQRANNIKINVQYGARRSGDADAVFNNPEKIKRVLGWRPRLDNLDVICRSAYEWNKKYLRKHS